MKKLILLSALAFGLGSCSDNDDNPQPKTAANSADLIGKWDAKTSERKEYSAAGQLTTSNTQTFDAGVQIEYLANGLWKQYDQYKVVDNGRYQKNGNKITVKIHING